jgi:16S rRNA (uracil1498-N3)-methyltransferase
MEQGTALTVFCGDGKNYEGILSFAHKKNAQVTLTDSRENLSESPLKIHLIQGLCKGEKMDFILQKATELGVYAITPVIMERTQGNKSLKDPSWLKKKNEEYQKIVISACEQSGRSIVPMVHPTLTFEELLHRMEKRNLLDSSDSKPAERFILSPHPTETLPALSLKDLSLRSPSGIEFMVGPEGGFTSFEVSSALEKGYLPLLIGPRILRTETAALAFIAGIQTRFGDF